MKFKEFLNENTAGAFKSIKQAIIDIIDNDLHLEIEFIRPVENYSAEYALKNIVSNVDKEFMKITCKRIVYTIKGATKADFNIIINELDKHNLKYEVNGKSDIINNQTL